MAARVPRRAMLSALLTLALVPADLRDVARAEPQGAKPGVADKSLFLSVLDAQGRPVPDVRMGDILIREDGQDREIVAIKPASQPISVVFLIDTAQGNRVTDAYGTPEDITRDIRVSVAAFGKHLLSRSPDASVMLMEFGQASIPVVPFTQNYADYEKGVNRLTAKPNVGSVLLEAIGAANVELSKRPTGRRAIVSLNLEPSNEQSREEPKKIVESFRKSSAQLWSVSVQRGGLKNSKRDLVINDFAKVTGGQRDFVVGISAVPDILQRYAQALASQYEVVYKRPESSKAPQLIQVGTLLQNVKTHASGFPPQ